MAMRLTTHETVDYIYRKMGVKMSEGFISHGKMHLRKEAEEQLKKLRLDRFEYKYQYMKRIGEVELLMRKTWEIYELATEKKDISSQIKCILELKELTIILNNLYDLLPAVDTIRILGVDNNNKKEDCDVNQIQGKSEPQQTVGAKGTNQQEDMTINQGVINKNYPSTILLPLFYYYRINTPSSKQMSYIDTLYFLHM
jgi:hypothetical protein